MADPNWRGSGPATRAARWGWPLAALAAVLVAAGLISLSRLRPLVAPGVLLIALPDGPPFAEADHEFLRGLPGADAVEVGATRDRLRAALARLDAPAARPRVVVLSGRVSIGTDGGAEFVGGDAADSERNRFPVAELMDRLPAPPTLAVLRLVGPADALRRVRGLAAESRALILLVSEPNDQVLPPRVGGQSLFADALKTAWRDADGVNANGRRDYRVSAGELAAEVRESLDSAARTLRVDAPRAELLGTGDDFPLAEAAPPVEAEPGPPRDYPPALQSAWQSCADRLAAPAPGATPARIRAANDALLRAERDWAAGRSFESGLNRAAAQIRLLGEGARPGESQLAQTLATSLESADAAAPLPPATVQLLAGPDAADALRELALSDPPLGPRAWRNWVRANALADPTARQLSAALAATWATSEPRPAALVARARLRLESAAADSGAYPWLRGELPTAAAALTRAEAYLAAPGFAPPASNAINDADRLAGRLDEAARGHAVARRVYLSASRVGMPPTAGKALRLALTPPESGAADPAAAASRWAAESGELARRAADAASAFGPAAVARAIRAENVEALDELLQSPLPAPADRAAAWAARLAIEARLMGMLPARGSAPWADPRRPSGDFADPPPSPATWPPLPAESDAEWRRWVAGRAAFGATDPADLRSPPLADWATRRAATLGPAERAVPLVPTLATIELTPDHPRGELAVPVRLLHADRAAPASVIIEQPADGWLIAPPVRGSADPVRATPLVTTIAPGPRLGEVAAAGVVARVECAGLSVYRRVPVRAASISERLTVAWLPAGDASTGEWRLRPGGVATAKLVVTNRTPAARSVVVRWPAAGRESLPLALAVGESKPVAFAPAAAPTPLALDLPADVTLELLDADAKSVRQTVKLGLRPIDADSLVGLGRVSVTPKPGGGRLTAEIRLLRDAGGPLPVTATLTDAAGRAVVPAEGDLAATLSIESPKAVLSAAKLTPGESVRVAIEIDGVARAVIFEGVVPRDGPPTELARRVAPGLELSAPDAVSGEKPLEVRLSASQAPPGATVRLALGPAGGEAEREAGPVPATRRAVTLEIAPGGVVRATTTAADPVVSHDVRGLSGVKQLRGELVSERGELLASAARRVVFDRAAPTGLRFVGLPPVAPRGEPLRVVVAADVPASGVKSVQFFLGEPVNDAPPKDAVVVAGKPLGGGKFAATLPGIAAPSAVVSVQVTSNAGVAAFLSAAIETADPKELAKPKPGKIAGVVREGAVIQPKLTVAAYDAADPAKPKATATTDAAGKYELPDLAPGKYVVYCEKTATGRAARAEVEVAAGQAAEADLALVLK